MTSYADRLKDPRWQRRRLEILQHYDWACGECGAREKTLHVDHKLYRKGAMPWEYENHELQALCVDCHASTTNIRAAITISLARLDSFDLERVLGYVDGLWIDKAWEAPDITKLPPWNFLGEGHAQGIADGMGIDDVDEEFLGAAQMSISDMIVLQVESNRARMARKS